VAAAIPLSLRAQACLGSPTLGRPFRIAIESAWHSYASSAGIAGTAGTRAFFGGLGAARAHDEELGATATDLTLEGGAIIALDRQRRVELCPVASLTLSLGPKDLLLTPEDQHRIIASAGANLGGLLAQWGRIGLRAFGGSRMAYIKATREYYDPQPASLTATDWFLITEVGLSATLNNRWTLRPRFTMPLDLVGMGDHTDFALPFGWEDHEISLAVALSLTFGKLRSAQ